MASKNNLEPFKKNPTIKFSDIKPVIKPTINDKEKSIYQNTKKLISENIDEKKPVNIKVNYKEEYSPAVFENTIPKNRPKMSSKFIGDIFTNPRQYQQQQKLEGLKQRVRTVKSESTQNELEVDNSGKHSNFNELVEELKTLDNKEPSLIVQESNPVLLQNTLIKNTNTESEDFFSDRRNKMSFTNSLQTDIKKLIEKDEDEDKAETFFETANTKNLNLSELLKNDLGITESDTVENGILDNTNNEDEKQISTAEERKLKIPKIEIPQGLFKINPNLQKTARKSNNWSKRVKFWKNQEPSISLSNSHELVLRKKPNFNSRVLVPAFLVICAAVTVSGMFWQASWAQWAANNTSPNTDQGNFLNRFLMGKNNVEGSIIKTTFGWEVSSNEYEKWITLNNNGVYSNPDDDLDKDNLTNIEEMYITSNPVKSKTCNPQITDGENLANLFNPATCLAINTNDQDEFAKFNRIINISYIQNNLKTNLNVINQISTESSSATNVIELYKILGLNTKEDLLNVNYETLKETINNNTTDSPEKLQYLQTIKSTDEYIKKYRSYALYNRNYESPVNGSYYLYASLKYKVPMKYMLAVARIESQFGTNQFNADGSLNRIGENQNIYSLGLDQSGNNVKFTWAESVEAFAKWYQSFEERGVKDCQKWKIFNPNGDFCATVENLALDVEKFLSQ
jgi:hypothetical protein